MDTTFTPYKWLNYLFLAFLLGFGWACGTWLFSALLIIVQGG